MNTHTVQMSKTSKILAITWFILIAIKLILGMVIVVRSLQLFNSQYGSQDCVESKPGWELIESCADDSVNVGYVGFVAGLIQIGFAIKMSSISTRSGVGVCFNVLLLLAMVHCFVLTGRWTFSLERNHDFRNMFIVTVQNIAMLFISLIFTFILHFSSSEILISDEEQPASNVETEKKSEKEKEAEMQNANLEAPPTQEKVAPI